MQVCKLLRLPKLNGERVWSSVIRIVLTMHGDVTNTGEAIQRSVFSAMSSKSVHV